jgi:hypothetical protein
VSQPHHLLADRLPPATKLLALVRSESAGAQQGSVRPQLSNPDSQASRFASGQVADANAIAKSLAKPLRAMRRSTCLGRFFRAERGGWGA